MTVPFTQTIAHYSDNAQRFSDRFDSILFEDIHQSLLNVHIPPTATRILDIGAGNGRDADGLARLGFEVTAVEPAAGLRDIGIKRTEGLAVTWVDDQLPALSQLSGTWPFICCNAVFQHIPPEMRHAALARMADLLAPNGRLYIAVRQGPSDAARPTYPITQHDVQALAADLSLTLAHYEVQADKGKDRPDVSFIAVRFDRT